MTKKINWIEIFQHYCASDTISYGDLSNKFGVGLQTVKERGAKEKWQELRTRTIQQAYQMTMERTANEIAKVNARQVNIARTLQIRGLVALEKERVKIASFKEAKESILAGIALERKVLGMDTKDFSTTDQQQIEVILP